MKITILFLLISFSTIAQNLNQVNKLLEQGNYQLALNILKDSEKSFKNLEKIGTIYQKTGNYGKAIANFENALTFKNSYILKEKLGKAYQNYGNSNKAIILFNEVLENKPKNYLLKYHLAKLYFSTKKNNEAKKLFLDLISNDKNNPNFYYYLGRVYEDKREIINAKKAFQNAIKIDVNHVKSYYKLAKIFRKEKNRDSTNFYLKNGLTINPNNVLLLQLNSKIAYKNKNYASVISSVKKLDSLHVISKLYEQLYAYVHYHTKEYEKASELLLNLLLTKKADEKTLFYLGLTHKELKHFEEANYYFLMSIKQQTPQLWQHYYQLGLIAVETNDAKKAIENFKKSIKEKPYNPDALYQLATLSEDYYKDKKIALNLYKKYLNIHFGYHQQRTKYVQQQIKKIETTLFFKN